MWYPEKLLYKKLGVAPGNGADTDYQDAATLLAKNEGISDGQIEEALRNTNGDGAVNNRPSTPRARWRTLSRGLVQLVELARRTRKPNKGIQRDQPSFQTMEVHRGPMLPTHDA